MGRDAGREMEKPMKEYTIYGVRQYSAYIMAEIEEDAMRQAKAIPLHEWEPNEISGEEILPKEACEV